MATTADIAKRYLTALAAHDRYLTALAAHDRDSDRLVFVSDCFSTLDPQTGRKGAPRVPHPAFHADVEQARASIRKLAAMEPSSAWAGHADPVNGNVRAQLERGAAATL